MIRLLSACSAVILLAALILSGASCAAPGAAGRTGMPALTASRQLDEAPEWAVLQRELLSETAAAAATLLDKYIEEDGSHRWPPRWWSHFNHWYEPFHNWPLVYLMGGDEQLLRKAHRQFEAPLDEWEKRGVTRYEFPKRNEWFHLGEGYYLFYMLSLADPANETTVERATRFAGFYLGHNYDPEVKIIRWPDTGSVPREPWDPDDPPARVRASAPHGLPFYDLEGIQRAEDLDDEENMRRMARAVHERWSRGDAAVNLGATSLVLNAYMLTGEEEYADWVLEYVDAWRRRIRENDGILPDNVGKSGEIGQYMDGRWYGGRYGWTQSHGWGSLAISVGLAAENATLLTGDAGYMNMLRSQIDMLAGHAIERNDTLWIPCHHGEPGRVHIEPHSFLRVLRKGEDGRPDPDNLRHGLAYERDGWFYFKPMDPVGPAHLWNMTMLDEDFERHLATRNRDPDARWPRDWERILNINRYFAKDHGGHEAAWLEYLAGGYPAYPVEILRYNLDQVRGRVRNIERHEPEEDARFHLRNHNPVTAEGLVNLTMGGPLPFYNGGLLQVRVRHFDPVQRRPGLPEDVAALVSVMEDDRTVLTLVNLSENEKREVIVQAGGYGEHRFGAVKTVTDGEAAGRGVKNAGTHVRVRMAPRTMIKLDMETERFVNRPSYAFPWH